jgi:hypothetical protein
MNNLENLDETLSDSFCNAVQASALLSILLFGCAKL